MKTKEGGGEGENAQERGWRHPWAGWGDRAGSPPDTHRSQAGHAHEAARMADSVADRLREDEPVDGQGRQLAQGIDGLVLLALLQGVG